MREAYEKKAARKGVMLDVLLARALREEPMAQSIEYERPDGKRVAAGGMKPWTMVFDVESGAVTTRMPGCVTPFVWMADGKKMVTGVPVRVWSVKE